jgi:FMN phosphatase YigB (HAD superfamily)
MTVSSAPPPAAGATSREALDHLLGRRDDRQTVHAVVIDFAALAYPGPAETGKWLCSAINEAFDWPPPVGFSLLLQKAITAARSAGLRSGAHTALPTILRAAANQYCARLPSEAGLALVSAFDTLPRRRIDPEAAHAVTDLSRRYSLVLATTSDVPRQVLESWLEDAGVGNCFTSLVLPGELGKAMPAPGYYEHLVRLTAQRPDEVLFLGTSRRTAERGPGDIGMPALRIAPVWGAAYDEPEPAPRLREVPVLLGAAA